jgi:UDP-2,4-diacetamido-2,4,6-trideoxy-beta-L-altropyranose hydrolase
MTVTHIAFRTDATSQIGTGHFMRCLTLAEALKKQGAQIRFVSRGLPTHLRDMLAAKGVQFASLDSETSAVVDGDLAHAQWLGTSQAQDAQATIQALSDRQWDWIAVDHYALDARWESALRASTKQIMAIDDLADRHHDCDVLLDQNFYADMHTRYEGRVPVHCQQLLGPGYALLRDEFRKLREQVKPRTGVVKKILVFFGGVDADNYTGLAIRALAAIGNKALHIDVVIGAQHPYREQIQQACVEQGFGCHVQTTRMAELMAEADLAIGAGGSASWERCCLGLPALLVALADNQIDIAKALDSAGACIYLGTKETANTLTIQRTITNLLDAHEQLKRISQRAVSLVDGIGVERVCQELGC